MLYIGDKQPLGIVCYILFLATLYLGGEYQGFKHMELVTDFLMFSFHQSLPTFMQTVCLLQVCQRKKLSSSSYVYTPGESNYRLEQETFR